jgi:N-acyl-D-aspartate/D-glutamate deacylase
MNKTVYVGAMVVDGTGAPAAAYDVFVDGERIEDVRPHADTHAGWNTLDARSLVIAPGFIDVHSHGDNAPLLPYDDTMKILQGVTTEVVGNCGISLAPTSSRHRAAFLAAREAVMPVPEDIGSDFAGLLRATDAHGYVTNYVPLVGHGTLRWAAMGMERRAPTSREQAFMRAGLEEAIEAGAFGLSSGLIYPPGVFSGLEELVDLAKCLPPGRIYTSHIRGEGDTLLEAVAEALAIGEKARVPVQISHHKACGKKNWGKTRDSLELIRQARARGVVVHQDVYPYTAGSTYLKAVLPPEFHEGGNAATLERLADPEQLRRLREILESDTSDFQNFVAEAGYDGILIAFTPSHRFEGRTIAEIAAEMRCSQFEALIHVLVSEQLSAMMTIFLMDEDDIARVLRDEHTAIGSDGASPGVQGRHHPRSYGTFPRVIAHHVRERGTLTLESAVHKMTGLPARIFNIPDRGTIAPGKIADLVAFDAQTFSDDLDYRDPVRNPKGLAWVTLGGAEVVRGTSYLGRRCGARLQPSSKARSNAPSLLSCSRWT